MLGHANLNTTRIYITPNQNDLEQAVEGETDTRERLRKIVRTHLYLSELLQQWFTFFFMETKNLQQEDRKIPTESELYTEQVIVDILEAGMGAGIYACKDPVLAWGLAQWSTETARAAREVVDDVRRLGAGERDARWICRQHRKSHRRLGSIEESERRHDGRRGEPRRPLHGLRGNHHRKRREHPELGIGERVPRERPGQRGCAQSDEQRIRKARRQPGKRHGDDRRGDGVEERKRIRERTAGPDQLVRTLAMREHARRGPHLHEVGRLNTRMTPEQIGVCADGNPEDCGARSTRKPRRWTRSVKPFFQKAPVDSIGTIRRLLATLRVMARLSWLVVLAAACVMPTDGPGRIVANGIDMRAFAGELAPSQGRPVVDMTGLDGRYDIDLTYTPEIFSAAANARRGTTPPPNVDPNGPPLATALVDQLGLKLEATRAPIAVIVIDRIEMLIAD